MKSILSLLILVGGPAMAKNDCSVFQFDRAVFPKSVHELHISVFNSAESILLVSARTKLNKEVAEGLFVCRKAENGKTTCTQDDDGGGFELSGEKNLELKSNYFRLIRNDDETMAFMSEEQRKKSEMDSEEGFFVLKGRTGACVAPAK